MLKTRLYILRTQPSSDILEYYLKDEKSEMYISVYHNTLSVEGVRQRIGSQKISASCFLWPNIWEKIVTIQDFYEENFSAEDRQTQTNLCQTIKQYLLIITYKLAPHCFITRPFWSNVTRVLTGIGSLGCVNLLLKSNDLQKTKHIIFKMFS